MELGYIMEKQVTIDSVYIPSQDVVTREIEGEIILIPITSGIGDMDEIYTLNETGRAIWRSLDGKKSLREVAASLETKFIAKPDEIEKDVQGLVNELLKRKMLIPVLK